MLGVLRNRDFRFLFAGGLVSSLGDWFLFIALPFYVYSLTGSALATGGTFIAESLPTILFGSVAGVYVDRWDRRRTMIVADLLRAVLILGLLAVRSPETVWIVFAVSFAQSTIGQFFGPSKDSLIPRIVGDDDLLAANSLSSMGTQVTMLVGPALGGASLALFGMSAGIAADSASFLFSALMAAFVGSPRREVIVRETPAGGSVWQTAWRDYREGISLMGGNAVVVALLLAMGITEVGQGMVNVQLIPWVKDVLHGDALVLGWIVSAQGVGGVIGGLALGSVGQSFSPSQVLTVGLLSTGLIIFALVSMTVIPVILILVAMIGVAVVAFVIRLQTLLQTSVEDAYRGRVLGAYNATQSALLLLGMGLAGALGGIVGPVPTLEMAGLLYAVGGVVTAFVLPRALRTTVAALALD
ncbi:MAG TPA: MFS transporter [Chloroflexota bacterium]|nr:MFS transporter [Chloroflexota bacterium]